MTVIAYKDGIMACDSCWADPTAGSIDSLQNKITRFSTGVLYGASGDADDRDVVRRFQRVRDPKQIPLPAKLRAMESDVSSLLVFPDGSLFLVSTGKSAECMRVARQFHAIGTGGQLAVGAMARGASAIEAVHVACEYNTFCRPPIHSLSLGPPAHITRRSNPR